MHALDGLTVLDLSSWIAGPYTTKLLADLGARVIKVEQPGGDPARRLEPFLHDEPGPERSATFQFLNTNKDGIVLDLKSSRAAEVVRRLAGMADLIVTASSPAQEERLGISYATLSNYAPETPVVSLTNFGHSGPYRDYLLSETTLYAMGGEMYSHGLADRSPLKIGGTAALLQCGAMAAVAAMGAVHAREVHSIGQLVDVPLFQVQINNADRRFSSILAYRFSGRIQDRPAGASTGLAGGIYPCADGYVEVTASFGDYWRRFVEMIGDDTLREPRWMQPATQMDSGAKAECDSIVYPWMLTHTRAEIWAEARRARAMVAPLNTGKEIFEDPVFRERGLWTEMHHATLGTLPMLGRPYILEKTPWELRRPAPMLGEHTDRVLADAGHSSAEITALREEGVVA